MEMDWASDVEILQERSRQGVQFTPSDREALSRALSDSQQRLSELLREADQLRRTIAHQQSSLSPLRLLPTELLVRILRLAIVPGMVIQYDETSAPWNIGAVSRHWRDVLYSTPELWTAIEIDWNRWNRPLALDAENTPYPARVAQFLELSSALPLLINVPSYPNLVWGTQAEEPQRQAWTPIYRRLEDELLTRWSGSVDAQFLRQLWKFRANATLTLPMITGLRRMDEFVLEDLITEANINLRIPQLQDIILKDIWRIDARVENEYLANIKRHATAFLGDHASNLRALEFRGQLEALAFVSQCPSSQHIMKSVESLRIQQSLSFPGSLQDREEDFGRILVPSIRHLFIADYPGVVAAYLQKMKIPTIKSLQLVIKTTPLHNDVLPPALLDFLRIPSEAGGLESLCLAGIDIPEGSLPEILNELDTLRELVLWTLPHDIETALTTSTAILPALRRLTILDNTKNSTETSVLVEILGARHPGARVFSFKSFKRTWAFVDGGNLSAFDEESLAFDYRLPAEAWMQHRLELVWL
ncbi:hypothetical protein CC1G_08457 [Coprinopsis cinerea okayama7|uniref:Uncharacterized protein n=1 Tax=Coprinopsis cinerea (strain Okayama-7 / 130 / ATCC MYA-4618 / FGSC 9003) TaxID=240176 RepID=A8NLZ9_COPC7|nr:hypothetical protein CC1G_08457 [Coprinopsis cinerea okayama7\|eukprot:XP_001834812.1 hypothetical protein CC1G_08457 [Coprinopsis cinerea okayama7\